jgi:hypothetical protein
MRQLLALFQHLDPDAQDRLLQKLQQTRQEAKARQHHHHQQLDACGQGYSSGGGSFPPSPPGARSDSHQHGFGNDAKGEVAAPAYAYSGSGSLAAGYADDGLTTGQHQQHQPPPPPCAEPLLKFFGGGSEAPAPVPALPQPLRLAKGVIPRIPVAPGISWQQQQEEMERQRAREQQQQQQEQHKMEVPELEAGDRDPYFYTPPEGEVVMRYDEGLDPTFFDSFGSGLCLSLSSPGDRAPTSFVLPG